MNCTDCQNGSNCQQGTPGNSWWSVPPGSPNPDSISDPKKVIFYTCLQTRREKSISIFRPGLYAEIMLKKFFKSISNLHISLFFLLIWNWSVMVRFQTKTVQKPTRWGGTYLYYSLYKGAPSQVSTTLTWTIMFWIWYFPSGCSYTSR